MKRGRKAMSAAEKRAFKEFTLSVIERFCCEIQPLIEHECGGGHMDACHVLPKRFIRRETNLWPAEDRIAAIWDPDNGLAGCRNGHNLFDAPGHGGVTVKDLPDAAVAFAERHGWSFELEREYGA